MGAAASTDGGEVEGQVPTHIDQLADKKKEDEEKKVEESPREEGESPKESKSPGKDGSPKPAGGNDAYKSQFQMCLEVLQTCDQWTEEERAAFVQKIKDEKLDYLVDATDDFGNTLLLISTMGQQVEVVRLLLEHGADPDHQNAAGFCALHYCCVSVDDPERMKRATEIVKLLLQNNASPNLVEIQAGCTPLHYAASENNREICDLLLTGGAKVSMKCKNSFLPEAYARAGGHNELADYLHKKIKKTVSKQVKAKMARQKDAGGHGWEKHVDKETGRDFYFNTRTQKSTWDRPVELDLEEGDESEEEEDDGKEEKFGSERTMESLASGDCSLPTQADDEEKEKLKEQLSLMQKQLEEAHAKAERERQQVAELQRVAKEADDKYASQLAELKSDLASKATNEEESMKQLEKLKVQFEVAKKNEMDKLRREFDKEKEEEKKRFEAMQEEERRKHEEELTKKLHEMQNLEEQLQKELKEKKQYYNEIEELKGNIRVTARVRPLSKKELERGCENVVEVAGNNIKMTYTKTTKGGEKTEHKMWSFDKCLGPARTQDDVFEDMSRLIQSAIDGYNVCIFAYGQTGAGKTYTMAGSDDNPGILPRSIETLYDYMDKQRSTYTFSMDLYMCELHLDSLVDLLAENGKRKKFEGKDLQIKKDQFGVVFVENISVIPIESKDHLIENVKMGEGRRKTDSTNMNDESSRSHLVTSMVVRSENIRSGEITSGKITLVDLAGSERVAKSGAEGETFKEATSINKALSALGEVINALTTKQKHIPYRNNCLTQLMSDSIGGNAKTLMVVNVSPADYNAAETIASLNFAARCKNVNNAASKGFETKELAQLRREIARLRKQNSG